MRVWAKVYDSDDTHLGDIFSLKDASVTEALDGAGNISFSIPLADKDAFDLLVNERLVRLYVEHDETTRELGRGVVRTRRIQNMETMQVNGPDDLTELTRRSVLLGRNFQNETMQDIAEALIALVPGWTATVATSYASLLQSCRYDGTNVLKALIRLAEERGLHLRQGSTAGTIEIGPFGTDNGIQAVAPETLGHELYLNDDLILISNITQVTETRDLINWIIPIGAGNGTAAQTLRESTRSISGGYDYDIGTMAGPDGRTLYYLSNAASITTYGQSEKVVTFKEIGPVANSSTAKQLAANALYDAAAAWLDKNCLPLVTYKITAKKVRQNIRVGDKIRVTYKGYIETAEGDVVPIDLSYEQFWVMKKTERVGVDGMTLDLEIASVDRYEMDTARVVVGALEAINVKNVAVEMFPFAFQDSSERVIQGSAGGTSSPDYKPAQFSLRFPNIMTDVISVYFQIKTRPLYTWTISQVLFATNEHYYYYNVYVDNDYPSDVGIIINGVDRTSALGGPWNPSAGNSPIDETLDISEYIIDDAGGIFQDHSVVVYAGSRTGEARVNTSYPSITQQISHGIVEGKFLVLGSAQGIVPT